jgi:cation diffusion facilitator family transporter
LERDHYGNLKRGERGALISIGAYVCLSALKLLVGYLADSEALKADGFNNVADIAAALAVWIGLKISQRPPDQDHPYGHWKSEAVSSLVASLMIVAVGVQVLYQAGSTVFAGNGRSPDPIAAWTGLLCAAVMFLVYRYNVRLAGQVNSQAVKAVAKDNLSDVWVSLGAVAGIVGARFHLPWLDPAVAVGIGLFICKTGWDIFRETAHALTDGFDEEKLRSYEETVLSIKGVKGVKDIRARNYGNLTVVDLVLLVGPSLGITDAHHISSEVEKALMETHGVYQVHVHVEPVEPAEPAESAATIS